MKNVIAASCILGLLSSGMIGCNKTETSTSKRETTISTPGGTTKITTEKEVKNTGEKPPEKTP